MEGGDAESDQDPVREQIDPDRDEQADGKPLRLAIVRPGAAVRLQLAQAEQGPGAEGEPGGRNAEVTLLLLSGQYIERDRSEHRAGGEVLYPAGQPGRRWAKRGEDRSGDGREDGEDDEQADGSEVGSGHEAWPPGAQHVAGPPRSREAASISEHAALSGRLYQTRRPSGRLARIPAR